MQSVMQKNMCKIKSIKKVFEDFARVKKTWTVTEFLEERLRRKEIGESLALTCHDIHKNGKFLEEITQEFCKFSLDRPRQNALPNIKILLYFLIFDFEENVNLLYSFYKVVVNLLEFLTVEENLIHLTLIACKIFDNDYVIERIINPLVKNSGCLKLLLEDLLDEENRRKFIIKKPATVSKEFNLRKSLFKKKDVEEVEESFGFKSRKAPATTYEAETETFKKIDEAREENREKARKLLEAARENAFRCAEAKKRIVPNEEEKVKIVAKPAPKFKPVAVKNTATSLMREAALAFKGKLEEAKEVEEIVAGGADYKRVVELEEEIRLGKQKEMLQEIERKHLEGLLTYEEAILAKKKLVKANQEKMQEFQQKRVKLLQDLNEWREREEEKNKSLVVKAQLIEKAAKESEQKLLKQKRCNAKLLEYETKKLLKEAQEKRQQELFEKIQLIQELKTLQQLNLQTVKTFDRTETCNLGLLCEMSVAELKERLFYLKVKMKEDLEERRKKILEDKKKQQEFLKEVEEFVEDSRKERKVRGKEKVEVKVEESKEILELREKLQQARNMRLSV